MKMVDLLVAWRDAQRKLTDADRARFGRFIDQIRSDGLGDTAAAEWADTDSAAAIARFEPHQQSQVRVMLDAVLAWNVHNPQPGTPGADQPSGLRGILPPPVLERFDGLELLGDSGGEGLVFRSTWDNSVGVGPILLKRYAEGRGVDGAVYDALREALHEHDLRVIRLFDEFELDGSRYEVLEWVDEGSLGPLIDSGHAAKHLSDVINELSQSVADFHTVVGGGHFDVKPRNVLVRSRTPLELVLGDLGLARVLDATVMMTAALGTPAYVPPESLTMAHARVSKSLAWDWWSVGMIIAEVAMGRHPLSDSNGDLPPVESLLALPELHGWRPVDLSEIDDERVRSLCTGLLLPDLAERWGALEVQDWRSGGSPRLPGTPAEIRSTALEPVSVLFDGIEYDHPTALASAFQRKWKLAESSLFRESDRTLARETTALIKAYGIQGVTKMLLDPAEQPDVPRHMATLLLALNPGLTPIFDGIELHPAGLQQAARSLCADPTDVSLAHRLADIRESRVLRTWRQLQGMDHASVTELEWSDDHRLLTKLVSTEKDFGPTRYQPGTLVLAHADAWLLRGAVDPGSRQELDGRLDELDFDEAYSPRWWTRLLARRHELTAAALALATSQDAAKIAEEARRHATERLGRPTLVDEAPPPEPTKPAVATATRRTSKTRTKAKTAGPQVLGTRSSTNYARVLANHERERRQRLQPLRLSVAWLAFAVLYALFYITNNPDDGDVGTVVGALLLVGGVATLIGFMGVVLYGIPESYRSLQWLRENPGPSSR